MDIAVILDELRLPASTLRWNVLLESQEFADFTSGQLLREVIEPQYIETLNSCYKNQSASQQTDRQGH